MADQSAPAVEAEEPVSATEPARVKKAKSNGHPLEALARTEIRRARRLVTDGQPTSEATFAVSVANVLALLDLAASIRESGERSSGVPKKKGGA